MKQLTQEGRQKVDDIAGQYNLHPETVESLLKAVVRGNGTMAQFNLAELGGQGQWMKGGMTMVGDMFNSGLRANVDKLCNELSALVAVNILFEEKEAGNDSGRNGGSTSNVASPTGQTSTSWPAVFGNPTSTGSQNNFRYAYFRPVHRLVVEENGKRTIYDTKHHQITGISQQQGTASSCRFTSHDGQVDVASLEIVSDPDAPRQHTPEMVYDVTATADLRSQDKSPNDIIIATIEKLNILFEKGQITEVEFKARKEELLARL